MLGNVAFPPTKTKEVSQSRPLSRKMEFPTTTRTWHELYEHPRLHRGQCMVIQMQPGDLSLLFAQDEEYRVAKLGELAQVVDVAQCEHLKVKWRKKRRKLVCFKHGPAFRNKSKITVDLRVALRKNHAVGQLCVHSRKSNRPNRNRSESFNLCSRNRFSDRASGAPIVKAICCTFSVQHAHS